MHPQNIFGEVVLLFIVGLILLIRDRGSAVSSTAYDSLIGGLLIVFSVIRMIEFLGGSRDSHVMSRGLVWLMWAIPLVIFIWLLVVHRRWDVGVMLGISIAALIANTIYLASGSGGYDLITPDQGVGTSNGVYTWTRTDGSPQFLPMTYYILLAVALIYLTAFSIGDRNYWILAGSAIAAFALASLFIPEVIRNPLGTLGSLSTLVMLGVGILAVLLTPG